jgi:catechol 2,3-dioxygenase-like lactoylglutathione lyase family enzyme
MLDHIGYEVTDLARSGRFYDAVFFALGVRRLHENQHVIGWGVTEPMFWLTSRSAPQPAYAAGLEAGGADAGAPGPRPQYGPRYYAAYLRDPDGLRVEVVASHAG